MEPTNDVASHAITTSAAGPARPAAATSPRRHHLRIGVLLGGHLVEERVVPARTPVSVGWAAGNLLTVPSDALPRSLVMFAPSPHGYVLSTTDDMVVRVAGDPAAPPAAPARPAPGPADTARRRLLSGTAHGTVTAGDVTLLFQLGAAPRQRLPRAVRGSCGGLIDRRMAKVLSFSGAVHVALFAYSLLAVEKAPPDFDTIPRDPGWVRVKAPEWKLAGRSHGHRAPGAAGAAANPRPAPARKPPRPAKRAAAGGATVADRVARDRDEARKVGLLAVFPHAGGAGGGAFGRALAGAGGQTDLDRAMKPLAGVTTSGLGVGLAAPNGGGRGGRVAVISDLGRLGGGRVDAGGRGTGVVRERRVTVAVPRGRAGAVDGHLDPQGARLTISRGTAAVKACYDHALKHSPNLGGKLRVRIAVGGAGTVRDVAIRESTLRDAAVAACVVGVIRAWHFAPAASGAGGTVEATWVFQAAE